MKLSLKSKTTLLIFFIALVLGVVIVVASNSALSTVIDRFYINKITDITYTLAEIVNDEDAEDLEQKVMTIYNSVDKKVTSNEWGSRDFYKYIGNYSKIQNEESYKNLMKQIKAVQNVNDVDCMYLLCLGVEDRAAVYMVDADEDEPCPPGCIDMLADGDYTLFAEPDKGSPAHITNSEEYGWLLSCAAPVYNDDGDIICYAGVDISMNKIKNDVHRYVIYLIIIIVTVDIILCIISMLVVNRVIVKPINLLSEAALKYCHGDPTVTKLGFATLDIRTGDEIERLSESMKQMERDINDSMASLFEANKELSDTREKAAIMNELAYKDALTGVRNKTSYDVEIGRLRNEVASGQTKFGMAMVDLNYLKKINDSYGHENGNIAIIKLCNIICAIFAHSPVFRVGGDEFVVILKNDDYDKVRSLVTTFNTTIDEVSVDMSINPWERVSAAIGYAIFDSSRDNDVEDVFKRADKAMYARKKEMKSIRV